MKKNALWTTLMVIAMGCGSTVSNTQGDAADTTDTFVPTDTVPADTFVPTDTANEPEAPMEGHLVFTLASYPTSGTAVKHQLDVPSVGVDISTDAMSAAGEVVIHSIRFTGQADRTGRLERSEFRNLVTSCSLYQDSLRPVLVGRPAVPDASGAMLFDHLEIGLLRGPVRFFVACSIAGSVVQPMGDRYSVGIADATDVYAETVSGGGVETTVSAQLMKEAGVGMDDPLVVIRVLDHGTLTITPRDLRAPTILVAGGDTWQNMAQFQACAQYEPATISVIRVGSRQDFAGFSQIGVWYVGAVAGWNVLPAGVGTSADITLTVSIMIPRDSCIDFQLIGKLNEVQAASTVSWQWLGVARSGKLVDLGIVGGVTSGMWGDRYAGHLNVLVDGMISGERLLADGASTYGNTFVVRKSMPVITRLLPSSTTLAVGDQDLFRFQAASSTPENGIAIKRITFAMSIHREPSSTFQLSQLRLRRGSTDMPLADYRIVDNNGRDLRTGPIELSDIVLSFTREEEIYGSGNVYTLHAMTSGTLISGDSVLVAFVRTHTATPVTGYLTSDDTLIPGAETPIGPHLDIGEDAMVNVRWAPFIWSDLSEVPHTYSPRMLRYPESLTGRDWTDDLYIDDLTWFQRLTR